MSALKSLPEVEPCGWYVRTRITGTARDGIIISNSGDREACHFPYAPSHGDIIAALTSEAINTARETGIGPAEMRRQRDELLADAKELLDLLDDADLDTEGMALFRRVRANVAKAVV